MKGLALTLMLGLTLACTAVAQDAPLPVAMIEPSDTPGATASAEAAQAAEALRAATGRLEQALTADDQVVALTDLIVAYERGQAALRQGLRQAAAREDAIRDQFDANRATLGRALGVMAGIGRAPEATLLLHPGGPQDTARAGMILAAVAPALRAEADRTRLGLNEIATIRKAQEGAAVTLAEGLGRVQEARRLLASAVADRSSLPTRFLDDPAELKALAASATSLESFAEGVSALETDVTAPLSDFAGAEGSLPLPVMGRVLRGYDRPDKAGVRRPGLVLETAPRALVTAPWPSTIRYRGPLLDYGNVMILEPARGYLVVLAGLAQVFGEVGDVIAAGEPVGLMGGDEGTPPEFGVNFVVDASGAGGATGKTDAQTLYLELRHGKETLDPAGWFVTDPALVAAAEGIRGEGDGTLNDGSAAGTDGSTTGNGTDE